MKLKRTAVLLVILIMSALLFSCTVNDRENQDGNNDTTSTDVIYSSVYVPNVIFGTQMDASKGTSIWAIYDELASKCPKAPSMFTDKKEIADREIVVGDTNRVVTGTANEILKNRIEEYAESEGISEMDSDIAAYAIYSEGNSVAIVYNNDYVGDIAVEYFIENYMQGSSLTLEEKHTYTSVFSLNEYVDERDNAIAAEKWSNIEQEIGGELGSEVVGALKNLYKIYSDDVISWIANLYDPISGGFYHSNSARNTQGFSADIESTYSALGFIETSGMLDDLGCGFADVIPDWMREQIVNFVYNMQAEDGYFYHPQWGDSVNDTRRARDLSSATIMLNAFGVKTKYPYPGSGTSAASLLSKLSGSSAPSAVSKVIAVSSVPEKFSSELKFREYLDSMDFKTGAYDYGSILQSLIGEMRSYGKSQGIDFVGITIEKLNGAQNKENGLWHTAVNYYGTNGLHKIAYFYNQAKAPLPNVDKMLESTLISLSSNEECSAAVDIYNVWSCVGYIIKNIREYSPGETSEREARADEVIAKIRALAPKAIQGTIDKSITFRKDDGSFSYLPKYSTPVSEGVNVCVRNQVEGDLNGTGTIICALVEHIFKSLDISEYLVPRYTTSDRFRLMNILAGMGEIIKDDYEEPLPLDFENDSVGSAPTDVVYFLGSSGDGLTVIEHESLDGSRNVLRFDSNNDGGDVIQINNVSAMPMANMFIFEGDFYIDEIDTTYVARIMLSPAYILSIQNISGEIRLIEVTNQENDKSIISDLDVTLQKDTWYRMRIVQYAGDHDTIRTVLYLNGKPVAVSNNYYNKPIDGTVGEPENSFALTEIYVMGGKSFTLLLDNLRSYQTMGEYKPMILADPKWMNVDDPNSTWGIVPEGTKVDTAIPLDTSDEELDTSVFEATLNFTEATGGAHLAKISFFDAEDNVLSEYTVYCHDYDKALVGNARYRIRIFKDGYGYMSGANVGNKMEQDISIRIEYCFATGEIKVITNGKEVTKTFVEEASKVPVAKVVFTNLDAYSKFTYSNVKAENIATGRAGTTPEIPVRQETVTKAVTTVDEGANLLTTEFKVNYSKVAGGQNMNKLSFLDSAGNVINSIFIYCHDYDDSQSTATERYRIRAFADGVGYLTGANVGNKLGMDITFRIEYNWTSGAMKVYTNGNLAEHTFDKNATDTPIASVAFEALLDEVAYSVDIVTADATYVNAEQPPDEEENPSEDDTSNKTLTFDLTDVTPEGESANTALIGFTVNYSSLLRQEALHSIELLDADGNVINTVYLFANLYDGSQSALSDKYRIRISGKNSDGYMALIGGGLGNKPQRDVVFLLEFNFTDLTLTVTCNGTAGSAIDISGYEGNTLTGKAPVKLRVTPLSADAVYEMDFTQLELNKK
ncbi:MAG: hypothetical protein IJX92_00695 [Clostridia bacterium]|nr:hypothetical protein [Clostridia bacterium]